MYAVCTRDWERPGRRERARQAGLMCGRVCVRTCMRSSVAAAALSFSALASSCLSLPRMVLTAPCRGHRRQQQALEPASKSTASPAGIPWCAVRNNPCCAVVALTAQHTACTAPLVLAFAMNAVSQLPEKQAGATQLKLTQDQGVSAPPPHTCACLACCPVCFTPCVSNHPSTHLVVVCQLLVGHLEAAHLSLQAGHLLTEPRALQDRQHTNQTRSAQLEQDRTGLNLLLQLQNNGPLAPARRLPASFECCLVESMTALRAHWDSQLLRCMRAAARTLFDAAVSFSLSFPFCRSSSDTLDSSLRCWAHTARHSMRHDTHGCSIVKRHGHSVAKLWPCFNSPCQASGWSVP